MIIKTASFVCSNSKEDKCPKTNIFEFALIGRSNVGKSSLINYLTNKKKLAKTSRTPGKTQFINHYIINDSWHLVDLPGYGYAKTSKKNKEAIKNSITDYLTKRKNLKATFVLLDCRRKLQEIDLKFINWMGKLKLPFYIILTKIDKISFSKLIENEKVIKDSLKKYWEHLPPFFYCSSKTKTGGLEILNCVEENINLFSV